MTRLIELPSFSELENVLLELSAASGPAEAHGIIAGLISADKRMNGKNWCDFILGAVYGDSGQLDPSARQVLIELYEATNQQLRGLGFDFRLILPDDEQTLMTRAQALSYWCQGFLFGLGIAGINIKDALSEDSKDALYHISEISKLDFETIEATEQDENSYFEVSEYIRMSVLMIHGEFSGNGGTAGRMMSSDCVQQLH